MMASGARLLPSLWLSASMWTLVAPVPVHEAGVSLHRPLDAASQAADVAMLTFEICVHLRWCRAPPSENLLHTRAGLTPTGCSSHKFDLRRLALPA